MTIARRSFLAFVPATAILLAGCSAGADAATGAATAEPVPGGILKVGLTDLPPILDASITPYNNFVGRAVVDNLFDQNLETGEPEPWLATGYEVSDDGRVFTITLREGVTFSNGEVFDATAVKANLDNAIELRRNEGVGVAAAYISGYVQSTVIDANTVEVEFESSKASFIQGLTEKALGIVWPGSLALPLADRQNNGVIGTGPFIINEIVPDDHITIVRREGYAWPSPNSTNPGDAYLDAITFVEIPENGVLTESLLSGEIDATVSFDVNDIERLKGESFEITSRVSAGVPDTLYPNLDIAPFNDIAVRRAVQIGFDRTEINAGVYSEYSPIATAPVSTPVPGYVDLSDSLGYDPKAAIALLEKAGWVEGADGIREKDGVRLISHILFTSVNDKPALQLLQSQLLKIGFDLQLDQVTSAESTARQESGDWGILKGNFTRADPDVLLNTYHPDFVTYARYTRENVGDLADLLDAQTTELDPKKRYPIVKQALELIVDKGYSFPFNESGRSVAHAPTSHGYSFTLPGWSVFSDVWKES
ncbi:ABC transporter substrate-binding protein [Microbacteriaceae bacterium VKM Ac-2854]|nr:ABC transporter substrate-binding protein [Microbacteriaceae bacterium VKM Ac-2854]